MATTTRPDKLKEDTYQHLVAALAENGQGVVPS